MRRGKPNGPRASTKHSSLTLYGVTLARSFLDELENIQRDLGIELANSRVYGGFHPANAWEKNNHILNAPELTETRALVHDAYLKTHALNKRNQERYDGASHDDMNNPEWRALKEEETRERNEALEAVKKAQSVVAALENPH